MTGGTVALAGGGPAPADASRWVRVYLASGRFALGGLVLAVCWLLFGEAWEAWLARVAPALLAAGWVPVLLMLLALAQSPVVAVAHLVRGMVKGHELSERELSWGALHAVVCALALWFLVARDLCATDAGASGSAPLSPRCMQDGLLFVVDQFTQGCLGDWVDVFGPKVSPVGVDALGGLSRAFVLGFRMLCAACVLAVLLRLLGPVRRRMPSAFWQRWHVLSRRVWRLTTWAALISLLTWLAVAVAVVIWGEQWLATLDEATHTLGRLTGALLGVLLVAIPMLAPFPSVAYLLLGALAGHSLKGRELLLAGAVWMLCAGSLVARVEEQACTGTPEAVQACTDKVPGYVLDQFYKGAFADIFDVYELKLGVVPDSGFDLWTRIFVFNFRLLGAAIALGLLAVWAQRRQRLEAARTAATSATGTAGTAAAAAPAALPAEAPPPDPWPATVWAPPTPGFEDTEPLPPRPAA